MFVLESIQPKRLEETLFELKYATITRIIGIVVVLFTAVLMGLVLTNDIPSSGFTFLSALFLMGVGIYYGGRSISVTVNKQDHQIELKRTFVGVTYKHYQFSFDEVTNIYFENRWLGQTVQPKYRIYIEIDNKPYELGLVNQLMKAEYIKKHIEILMDRFKDKSSQADESEEKLSKE